MAMLKPFAALRPKPDLAARICELPYDVLSSEEARRIAAGNPLSFLRVSKPEIDLPAGTPLHSDRVYEKGAQNFRKLVADGALRPDAQPHFYLYRQVMAAHSQTGIVAAASCAEYLDGSIKKHEFTRPDKEDDRVRHIEGLGAQTGPAFLVYRPVPALNQLIAAKIQSVPDVDFTAADGVRHSSWTIGDAKEMGFVAQQFAHIPSLYIADGHHRSAAAARIFQSRKGAARSGQFLAVIFSADEVRILPYNRALADLNGNSPRQLLEKLEAVFTIARAGAAVPGRKHEVGFYFQGRWRTLAFRRELLHPGGVENLDVALLQKNVLAPVLGIKDPRTSDRIQFIGGIRGTAELEKLVNGGACACAFSMFPTSVEDLMAVADAGGVMPPKSTWFEPKLRDGMFCHLI